ncbi:MAG: hypothetical protein JST19_10540 [Bacteroidetes bacterium]|nr:hypothetical protein [Bacteroidota bacterium]
MNHIFTPKIRVAFFALLIGHLGLTQIASAGDLDTTKSAKGDTSLSKKADAAMLLRTDTTLVVKAGAKLVQKADTTLVINTDQGAIKNAEDAVAKKANDLQLADAATTKKMADPDGSKPDAATMVNDSSQSSVKAGQAPTRVSITSQTANAAPVAALVTSTEKTATTPDRVSITSSATTTDVPPASVPATATDNQANQKADDQQNNAQKNDNPQQTGVQQTAAKPDAVPAAKTDTVMLTKADTVIAKKPDSTFKKSDTTLMVVDTATNHQQKAENLYLELGGPGLAISANYDARFKKERSGWGYRVGLGYFGSGGNTVFTIPFQINYLYGEHAHKFELGAGTTFLNSTGTNVGTSKWEFDRVTGFIGTATIGYRYQPEHKGINFRIAFVPILYDEGLIPAGGISVGYTFK